MNYIKINGEAFELPTHPDKVNSVLNHIDMCKKDLKQFVRLSPLSGGESKKISAEVLKISSIYVFIDDKLCG